MSSCALSRELKWFNGYVDVAGLRDLPFLRLVAYNGCGLGLRGLNNLVTYTIGRASGYCAWLCFGTTVENIHSGQVAETSLSGMRACVRLRGFELQPPKST